MASDELTKPLENGHLARILDEISGLRAEFRTELGQVRIELGQVRSELKILEGRVEALDSKVEALDNKVEARLKDTRPLWEGVQLQLRSLQEKMDDGFSGLQEKMSLLNEDVLDVRTQQRRFDRRLTVLER
jgi:archaellum component FlaC